MSEHHKICVFEKADSVVGICAVEAEARGAPRKVDRDLLVFERRMLVSLDANKVRTAETLQDEVVLIRLSQLPLSKRDSFLL